MNKKVISVCVAFFVVAAVIAVSIFSVGTKSEKTENGTNAVQSVEKVQEKKETDSKESKNENNVPEILKEQVKEENGGTVSETQAGNKTDKGDTDADKKDGKNVCYISVSCKSVLKNMDRLTEEKRSIIPENGVILSLKETEFNEGDSAFDVLKREMMQNNIQMEFKNTPAYNSVYIEGIANLYEFDCGPMSGWLFAVNSILPDKGCSSYQVKSGDIIKWIYTCDMGEDIKAELK